MHRIGIGLLTCLALATCACADTIALWNFNDAVPGRTGGLNEFLVDRGSGTMLSTFAPSNIGNYGGTLVNSRDGDAAGQALNLAGSANNGQSLTWMAGTAGFESIIVSFAIQRSGTGFNADQFLYTADSGASWFSIVPHFSPGPSFAAQVFDLSGIDQLDNNPGAGFRIVFGGATSSTGNNRIDNLVVSGNPVSIPPDTTPVPEPSTLALAAAGLASSLSIKSVRRTLVKGD